jgi:hypothetical protein
MIWAIVASALAGFMIGWRYAVPALLAASVADVLAVSVAGWLAGWSLQSAAATALASLASLQGSYPGGVIARALARRMIPGPRRKPGVGER